MPSKSPGHRWTFLPRFRKRAFGWKSQPAVTRVRQAVAEILRVAKRDPVLAAEGAVVFLERVAPAIENVDGSSGSIGSAVNRAIEELAALIAAAPADRPTREAWLQRLWAAHEADRMPYIERLADHWGDLCVEKDIASAWADRLLPLTRVALGRDGGAQAFFHGTSACLSALLRAGRHAELLELLDRETFWPYRRWAVLALAATGRPDEAIRLAESSNDSWMAGIGREELCEEILLGCGRVEEAYARYAVGANCRDTYLGTFRAIAAKYPQKDPRTILADLVRRSPGEEGKWFAAAKDAGYLDDALELAGKCGADPRTLGRAARDFAGKEPRFAVKVGLIALDRFVHRGVEEVDPEDVRSACAAVFGAAERAGQFAEVREQVRGLAGRGGGLVRSVIDAELTMWTRARP